MRRFSTQRWHLQDFILLRILFLALLAGTAYLLRPFDLTSLYAGLVGLGSGLVIIFFEIRVRAVSVQRVLGGALGCLLAVCGAFVASLILQQAVPGNRETVGFVQIALLLFMGYVGLAIGSSKGEQFTISAFSGAAGASREGSQTFKILDTSAIIDGRISDLAETGFLEGTLIIPQFVLRELQLVADSADSLKRNRGRRGLDILQKVQKMPQLKVQIVDQDFPAVKEVDLKLIELAKMLSSKIVTTDFNLNKVAQLHGVPVLNINELANALKPVVLPGEFMRVFILKEGKEYGQGVAYLDDGTMVVVDNARKMLSKTIEITVTSVLQTTAGKMIFGKFDDRMHAVIENKHQIVEKPMVQQAGAAASPGAG